MNRVQMRLIFVWHAHNNGRDSIKYETAKILQKGFLRQILGTFYPLTKKKNGHKTLKLGTLGDT